MIIKKRNGLPILSGAVLAVAALLLLDAAVLARREPEPRHRLSFPTVVPAVFSLLGLMLLMVLPPASVAGDSARATGVLFLAWLSMLAATAGALTALFVCYAGATSRQRAEPGVATVLFTALVPLSASLLWWSRGVSDDNDD